MATQNANIQTIRQPKVQWLTVCVYFPPLTQSVSVMDMPTAAVSTGWRGESPASAAGEFVTVCTTLRDISVRNAKPASTETPKDLRQPLTPANVRHIHTNAHTPDPAWLNPKMCTIYKMTSGISLYIYTYKIQGCCHALFLLQTMTCRTQFKCHIT